MKGNAKQFNEFIEGSKIQFIIPVYQRNYDWKHNNCEQLFNDVVRLAQDPEANHFLGSIVIAPADSGYNRLVIDGQQRLTTISLLLLAAIKAVKEGKIAVENPSKVDEAMENFLLAKFSDSDRKIKLQPIEDDRVAYDKVFNDEVQLDEDSKVTVNFRLFYELLVSKAQGITFDQLLKAINRLQVIAIELELNDDPQLIFESLNSTGLALSNSDKVRNFMLMSLPSEVQQRCYKEYWRNIEHATLDKIDEFIRSYLTLQKKLSRPVNKNSIYYEWKAYMQGKDRVSELEVMLHFAKLFEQIAKAKLNTPKLSEKMSHILNLDSSVVYVFFMQFFEYARTNNVSEDEVFKVIDLVENFLARRTIVRLPSNALTQVFCSLHRDVLKSIKSYEEAKQELNCSYSEILAYHILRRDGNYQIPRDESFVDAIKSRDVYEMITPTKIFFLERLENCLPGESNDVAKELKSKEATIEHIMPQSLNESWKKMLGENFAEIHNKYLHTFANLTVTGINSVLGNKPFLDKRDGLINDTQSIPGYIHSKYRMTRWVSQCEKWTQEELEQRGNDIAKTLLKLYPFPKSNFKPLEKIVESYTLEDHSFNPLGRKLDGYRILGEECPKASWKEMIVGVVNYVLDLNPDNTDIVFDNKQYFMTVKQEASQYHEIRSGLYLLANVDNRNKLRVLRKLFEKVDIAESELVMYVEPEKK